MELSKPDEFLFWLDQQQANQSCLFLKASKARSRLPLVSAVLSLAPRTMLFHKTTSLLEDMKGSVNCHVASGSWWGGSCTACSSGLKASWRSRTLSLFLGNILHTIKHTEATRLLVHHVAGDEVSLEDYDCGTSTLNASFPSTLSSGKRWSWF